MGNHGILSGMKKAKAKVLIDTFHLNNSISGIGTYTTNLCLGLRANACNEFEFIEYPTLERSLASSFFKGKTNKIKKGLYHLTYFIWKQCVLPVAAVIKQADYILNPDYISPYFSNKKKIVVLHDTLFWEYTKNYHPLWRKYFVSLIEITLKKCDLILATSNYTKEKIIKIISPSCPIETVYQCHKSLPSNDSNALYENYLLHVGTFDNRKNINVLLEAFYLTRKKYSDLKLVLVGFEGSSKTHTLFEKTSVLIERLSLEEHVFITGYVSESVLSNLYKNATCYVFPSLDEGFGIPILEAQSFGVPVIVSNRGPLLEIGGDGVVSFEALDPIDLQAKIQLIVSDLTLKNKLVKKGYENLKNFNLDHFAKDTIKALKTINEF